MDVLVGKAGFKSGCQPDYILSETFKAVDSHFSGHDHMIFKHFAESSRQISVSEDQSAFIFRLKHISALSEEFDDVFARHFIGDKGNISSDESQLRIYCRHGSVEDGNFPECAVTSFKDAVDVAFHGSYKDKGKNDCGGKNCEIEKIFD